jgi:very-short-patch-repair endonuclease
MLLALLKYRYSLTILQEEGWYHIPVAKAPLGWPPRWMCFYQGKAFSIDEGAYRVDYYGEVESLEIVAYRQLFPGRFESQKSDLPYYRIRLKELKRLPRRIPSFRPRRLLFVPTTWSKFVAAEQINDLFDDSPLEDLLWLALKKRHIDAERQWQLTASGQTYFLDFAVFCDDGCVDIEADGDTWHSGRERVERDNERGNRLTGMGWHTLRFNGRQIRRKLAEDCLTEIERTITTLGGLATAGSVPRVFYRQGNQSGEQLSLFDNRVEYHCDSGAQENLEE